MKTSVGADSPETQADADRDGASDAAERDFEEDGRTLPSPTADAPPTDGEPPARPGSPEHRPAPDGPLDSSRGDGRGPTTTAPDPH